MAETTPIIGRTISRYRILEEVGRGGMATVYRALDTSLSREVAVKVLHPHLASESESKVRLEREAHAVAKLRHDNILEIFDYSAAANETAESFIVTEFIRGPTLTAFLTGTRVGVADVASMIVHELAAALSTAHREGVIHRDIKPENVMVRQGDGRVKLTDFGIAQIIDKERLTATGQLIGSPAYLAPELVEGGRVDFRTDVFSLGIVLYRVATGQLPFQGRNPHEMMKRIVEGRFTPPDQVNPTVGRGLARIIARALARRPDDRYPDMEAMRRDLAADLAAAGIEDPRAELGRYFADPAGWEKGARARMAAALCQRARGESNRSVALSLLGRALALCPGDATAKALLDRIGKRQRRGKAAVAAAAAVLVVGAAAGAVRYRAVHSPVAAGPASASAAEHGPASPVRPLIEASPAGPRGPASPGGAAIADAARPKPAPRVALRPPGGGTPSREGRDISLKIQGPAKRADIVIDPDTRFASTIAWTAGTPIHVGAGPHTLTVRHPSFWDETVRLGASDVAAEVRLRWRPAKLRVDVDPPAASVLVVWGAGRQIKLRVDPNTTSEIRVPENSTDGFEHLLITASHKDYESQDKPLTVRGGESFTVAFKLHPR